MIDILPEDEDGSMRWTNVAYAPNINKVMGLPSEMDLDTLEELVQRLRKFQKEKK